MQQAMYKNKKSKSSTPLKVSPYNIFQGIKAMECGITCIKKTRCKSVTFSDPICSFYDRPLSLNNQDQL